MKERDLYLSNIHCLKVAGDSEPLYGYDLEIRDGLVHSYAPHQVHREVPSDVRVIDCSSLVVIPGMVNTHHHFYQTLTRNIPAVQNAKLFDWLTYLYEIWRHIDEEAVYVSSLLAMGELLRTGCTFTTDHHYLYPNGFSGDLMGIQFEASDRLGMRFAPTRGSMSLSRKDGGLPPDSVVQSERMILEDSLRVIQRYHDPSPQSMHSIILAPCSPFSVTKDLMIQSSRLAREYGVGLHTHLAETMDENDYCVEVYGKRPLALMESCEFIGEDVFFAHGIHFNDQELGLLASTGTKIAHCPSSNMRLGSGICRVKEMRELGITVGIGVDGSASNDASDMLGEARNTLLLQRVLQGSDAMTADDVWEMSSEAGAKVLMKDGVGRLEPGWAADLALFDVSTFEYAGSSSDPVASLLFTGFDHSTAYTIVDGRVVVDGGALSGIDEDELSRSGVQVSEKLLKRAGIPITARRCV